MKLTFFGAAGTVTGSRYLLEHNDTRVLVDCGLFQGRKEDRLRNWEDPPFDPRSIDAVVLTHAHIDHTGYLPVLTKHRYHGPIHCTQATLELCRILLPDSGYLQEEEARYLNKHKMSRHSPALPLYTQADAEACLKYFRPLGFESTLKIGDMTFSFTRAGHILGSACIHVSFDDRTLVFSGDVGRPNGPVMRPPVPIEKADYLVLESTYGNRLHSQEDPSDELAEVIRRAAARSGIVVIPSFAVGRTQAILHLLSELIDAKQIPRVPIYLNSPMAINATEIYCMHAGEHRLSETECRKMFDVAEMVRSAEASRSLNSKDGPAVIISASGMATGGRVVHHLKAMLPDSNNTVLFAGFQAPGTRGAALMGGADEVKIHGQLIPVHAEVVSLDGLSAHADHAEILDWLKSVNEPPQQTFITHGEPAPAQAMSEHLKEALGWKSTIPAYGEEVLLT